MKGVWPRADHHKNFSGRNRYSRFSPSQAASCVRSKMGDSPKSETGASAEARRGGRWRKQGKEGSLKEADRPNSEIAAGPWGPFRVATF